MTELAESPARPAAGEIARISHWIDGKTVAGTSGRTSPVYNPATGALNRLQYTARRTLYAECGALDW